MPASAKPGRRVSNRPSADPAHAEAAMRMGQIVERMKSVYPEALCALEWNGEPWKLLIMGRLFK